MIVPENPALPPQKQGPVFAETQSAPKPPSAPRFSNTHLQSPALGRPVTQSATFSTPAQARPVNQAAFTGGPQQAVSTAHFGYQDPLPTRTMAARPAGSSMFGTPELKPVTGFENVHEMINALTPQRNLSGAQFEGHPAPGTPPEGVQHEQTSSGGGMGRGPMEQEPWLEDARAPGQAPGPGTEVATTGTQQGGSMIAQERAGGLGT